MSSTNGNNDLSDANQNGVQPTNQVQQRIGQITQPSQLWGYRFPNINYLGPQRYNPSMPFPVYPPPTMDWMSFGAPASHYQTYQPPYLQQFQAPAMMQAQLPQMSIYPAVLNSYGFNINWVHAARQSSSRETQPVLGQNAVPSTHTANSSQTSATQSSGQNFIPTTLSYQVSSCSSVPAMPKKISTVNTADSTTSLTSPSLLTQQPETDKRQSPSGHSTQASSSLSYETQPSGQDAVPPSLSDNASQRNSVPETASKNNVGLVADSRTRTTRSSSSAPLLKRVVHPSLCDNLDYASNALSTCDIQLIAQDVPSRPRQTAMNKRRLSTSSSESEKPQKRKYIMCQCPNCRAKGGNQKRYPSGALKHVCHIRDCGRVFGRPSVLKQHLDSHSDKNNFFCHYCNRGFSRKLELSEHLKSHKKAKPNDCQCPNCSAEGGNKTKGPSGRQLHACHIPRCGRVFSHTYTLKRHLECHAGEKNFVCQYCDKGFARKDRFEEHVGRHLNTHQRNQPERDHLDGGVPWNFLCAHCDEGFAHKDTLCRHLKFHMNAQRNEPQDNDVEFVQTCSPEATSSRKIDAEKKIGNTKKRVTCHFAACGKDYATGSNLSTHLKWHYGNLYACKWPLCGRKFTHKCYRLRHERTHKRV